MTFKEFNSIDEKVARDYFLSCCGSSHWVDILMKSRPFSSIEGLLEKAKYIWFNTCSKADYLEAFSQHPVIGDIDSLSKKFTPSRSWANDEQSGVAQASDFILKELISFNKTYLNKFGYIFLVFATGKSAEEMLKLGVARLKHGYKEELFLAAGEQFKITLIRLSKIISEIKNFMKNSQITTHVLDTSKGIPGRGITVRLQEKNNSDWKTISVGVTDRDGRISDLLPSGRKLQPGLYQFIFETGTYFEAKKEDSFSLKLQSGFM